jgi:regulator of protease activity HflC (stomatin/prohibitin superfamily)
MTILLAGFGILIAVGLVAGATSLRVVKQYERGVVFRFGRVRPTLLRPGLALLVPGVDRLQKVNMQIITMPVPAQDGITRDNITVRVDAVVYFSVMDAVRAAVDVQDYPAAIGQVAQTSLRSIIGKSDLDDLLSNREHLNEGMELMINSPALDWGIHIERVEIKDVSLPETMKRSMSRQAEAERERRARVITADGELQASERLAQAAEVMAEHPAALQLRLLQTVVEVAAERNSTLVLPFPVELLRFLERVTPPAASRSADDRAAEQSDDPVERPTTSTKPEPTEVRVPVQVRRATKAPRPAASVPDLLTVNSEIPSPTDPHSPSAATRSLGVMPGQFG